MKGGYLNIANQKWNMQSRRGQGAFEYLLLIGGVLFLAVAVIMILSNSMTQTAQSTTGSNYSGNLQTNISQYGNIASPTATYYPGVTTTPTPTPKPSVTVTVVAGATVTVVAKPSITATPTPTATVKSTSTPKPTTIIASETKEEAKYVNWILGIILLLAGIAGIKWIYNEYKHEYS